ncbi:DEAD-box RNA helicase PRP5 PWA37_004988 [Arxiozyma heterogenica]|uniref:RNA helicase n=1 Tax=Arxiozyma heterogenica TaxID=278026 RepID=A0AAN7VYJ4_9SACH|nr:hypothetical protein RI543_005014 [Kazachstania heterogenica]
MESVSKPISETTKSKQQLLEERRARLAKWKLKKIQNQQPPKTLDNDTTKLSLQPLNQTTKITTIPTSTTTTINKILSTENNITNNIPDGSISNKVSLNSNNNNKDLQDDKSLARQKKIEAWKLKKRQRDASKNNKEQSLNPSSTVNTIVNQKKYKKSKNIHGPIIFDEENHANDILKSMEPLSFNHFSTPVATIDESSNVFKNSEMSENNNDNGVDIFEQLMDNLEKNEITNNKNNSSSINLNTFDLFNTDESGTIDDDRMEDSEDDIETKNKMKRVARLKKLKTVPDVNFNQTSLEPIRKVFYREPKELERLTMDDIEELRLRLGNIKVKGKNCPCPVLRWSQLGLSTSIMDLIENLFKFETLTPIQTQTIPAIMSGRDIIGISKTGSGKTLAYLLPLIRHIKAQRDLAKNETGPIGLILAPTRELALQISEEIDKFSKLDKSITSLCCTGGSEMKKQITDVKKGVKIVVATPGRFIDLLTLNNGNLVNTSRISFVVLDEADRLFDLGFEPQITQIMKVIRPDKQCILFSATFPNKLKKFAIRVLKDPLSITVNSANMVNENVKQSFMICNNDIEKFNNLLMILENHLKSIVMSKSNDIDEKIIIFVSSQQTCDTLYEKLDNYNYEIFSIHAGKSYQERVTNLNDFKQTPNSILICTEVLSRGLNVPEVSLVLIYNSIKTFAEYVHTTGRTARGTKKGQALTLLLKDELAAAYIVKKAIRENELLSHEQKQIDLLTQMANEFEAGLKNGKFKLFKGFGGKGLENIETQRQEIKDKEVLTYYPNAIEENSKNDTKPSVNNNENNDIEIPKLEYTTMVNQEIDSTRTYTIKVNVNDLPQLVRWEATKNTTLAFIKNETGCSITTRGRYYPPGTAPKDSKSEPKLYLLIETNEEKNIKLCIELLKEKVQEGIKKVEYQAFKNTKF